MIAHCGTRAALSVMQQQCQVADRATLMVDHRYNSDMKGNYMAQLTDRFTHAVEYARMAHGPQVRKGTEITYLAHLLSVAALVLENGGTEDQAIAGLLHDTLEDCGHRHEEEIRGRFGNVVAEIVLACTDGTAESKAAPQDAEAKRRDWHQRKQAYLAHLAEASDVVLLVSGCDKLHNARAVLRDLVDPSVGMTVFNRFTGGVDGTLWYYGALADVFEARGCRVAQEFASVVDAIKLLARPSA